MKKYYALLLPCFLVVLCACSKDAATSNTNQSSHNGAGGSMARFTVAANHLYLVDDYQLLAYDVSDAARPEFRSAQDVGFSIETIFPYRNKLFIGSATGMFVYSIDEPANPKLEGSVNHLRACDPVVGNDTVAYVTLRSFGTTCGSLQNVLNVYDLHNTASPLLVKTVDMSAPFGLGSSGNALYVCDGPGGLAVFDISKPYEPERIRTIEGEDFRDVIPYGEILICHTATGFRFYRISDPLQPQPAGIVND